MPEDEYPLVEVAKHRTRDDAWLVLDGRVLDVSGWLHEHPGGADILLGVAGSDATRDFEDVGHSDDARARLATMEIGAVRPPTAAELREAAAPERAQRRDGKARARSARASFLPSGAGALAGVGDSLCAALPSSLTAGVVVGGIVAGVVVYRAALRRT